MNLILIITLASCASLQGLSKSISDSFIGGVWEGTIFSKMKGFFGKNDGLAKYKNKDSKQGERFLFSTTFFVWLTDAWHLANMAQIVSQVFSLFGVLYFLVDIQQAVIVSIGYWTIRTIVFHVFFTKVFKKNNLS